MENWIDVPGYDGLYSVSDLGRVRRNAAKVWVRRSDHATHWKTYPEHIVKPIVAGKGYRATQLFKADIVERVYVHRLVYSLFVGPIPPGLEIDHIDRTKTNNVLTNLKLTDRKGNMGNPLTVLVMARGERHYNSKLRDADVVSAHAAIVSGERVSAVARRLGVNRQTIADIVAGTTWRHLGLMS
jgi:hypothetical protein